MGLWGKMVGNSASNSVFGLYLSEKIVSVAFADVVNKESPLRIIVQGTECKINNVFMGFRHYYPDKDKERRIINHPEQQTVNLD